MIRIDQLETMRTACARSHVSEDHHVLPVGNPSEQHGSLAEVLLAIEEKRGALYMRDTSTLLIENWNLRADRLEQQSPETLELLAKLLKL
jgi:hypothetical protein